jgi:hypothetical protein
LQSLIQGVASAARCKPEELFRRRQSRMRVRYLRGRSVMRLPSQIELVRDLIAEARQVSDYHLADGPFKIRCGYVMRRVG